MLPPNWSQNVNVPPRRYPEALKREHLHFQNAQSQQRTLCGLERSMSQSQSSERRHVPNTSEVSFFFFESLALLTCNIFAMRLQTLINTFLTSWETVSGEGMWYSGLPVFMSIWNPQSFTILKGRLLSDTQRTISALQGYRMRWEKSTRGEYEYLT